MATGIASPSEQAPAYVRPIDIARRLGLSRQRVSQLLKDPSSLLPTIRIGERTVLVRAEDFEAWLTTKEAADELKRLEQRELTPSEVHEIRRRYSEGRCSQRDLAQAHNISPTMISAILNGKFYAWVPWEEGVRERVKAVLAANARRR